MIYCWPQTRYKIRVIKLYKLPTISRLCLCLEEYFVLIVLNPCPVIKMDDAILYGLEKLNFTELRPNQRNVIEGYASGKDVFFCSPTGSGKSLTFEIAPFVLSYLKDKTALPSVCCIVVSPLVSLMRTQEKKMHSLGIRSVYLSEEDLSLHDIEKGHYDILLSSPETILGKYRNTVAALAKENLLGAIFIDEAHCIRKL